MKISLKTFLSGIAVFAVSFILSYSVSLGSISPFGPAFVAALPEVFSPIGLIAASLGYLLSPADEIIPLRYVATLFTILVIRGALKDKKNTYSPIFVSALTGISCIVTALTVVISTHFVLTDVLIYIFEAVLSAGAAYFFCNAFQNKDKTSIIVSLTLVLLALSRLEIWYINLSLVCCCYIFLIICNPDKKYYNCAFGVLAAVIVTLGAESPKVLVSYIVAAIIYLGLPTSITKNINEIIFPKEDSNYNYETMIRNKLSSIGTTIGKVSDLLDRVSEKTTDMFPEDISAAQMRNVVSKQISDTGNLILNLSDILEAEAMNNTVSPDEYGELYEVNLGAHQLSAKCNHRSGDYFTTFKTSNDKFVIMLSDGMGTGSAAAIGSTMSVEILSSLLKEGIDFESAINITNSAILANSGDETLSTIDMACIDLSTGKADFYKAGAAATLVRHGEKVVKLDRVALPIGILGNVEFSHASATLSEYDIVLMSSDGIWIGDELQIAKQLSYYRGSSMENLAKRIATNAFEKDSSTDDITVIAAQLLPLKSL